MQTATVSPRAWSELYATHVMTAMRVDGASWPEAERSWDRFREQPEAFEAARRVQALLAEDDACASTASTASTTSTITLPDEGIDIVRELDRLRESLVRQALIRSRGNKAAAADLLGIKRTRFVEWTQRYGIADWVPGQHRPRPRGGRR